MNEVLCLVKEEKVSSAYDWFISKGADADERTKALVLQAKMAMPVDEWVEELKRWNLGENEFSLIAAACIRRTDVERLMEVYELSESLAIAERILTFLYELGKVEEALEFGKKVEKKSPGLQKLVAQISSFQAKPNPDDPSDLVKMIDSCERGQCISHHTKNSIFTLWQKAYGEGHISIDAIHAMLRFSILIKDGILVDDIVAKICPWQWDAETFEFVIRSFAACKRSDRVSLFFHNMEMRGFEADPNLMQLVALESLEVQQHDLSERLIQQLHERGHLNRSSYMAYIRGTTKTFFQGALNVLEMMKERRLVDDVAYNCVLDAVVNAGQIDTAETILEEMVTFPGIQVDVVAFNTVLKGYSQSGQFNRALHLFNSLSKYNVKPNDVSYNSMMDAAIRAKRFPVAWNLLDQMENQGLQPDKFTVSILMKSITPRSDHRFIGRGIALVDKFIQTHSEDADEILFNSLLDAHCRMRNVKEIEETLARMKKHGVNPSAVTYGTVVKAYGDTGNVNAVLQTWEDMKQSNIGVNAITYGCLLDALVKCNKAEIAIQIFREMQQRGLQGNTVLYTTLIKGFSKQHNLQQAIAIYDEMRSFQIPRNTVTFNSTIDAAVRCNDMTCAGTILQDMSECGIAPDIITFSTLIKGYCNQGDLQKAFRLGSELKDRGLKADEIVFNSLLDGCVKASDLRCGLNTFAEMHRIGIQHSQVTMSILIKLFTKCGRCDRAFNLIRDIEIEYGEAVTGPIYQCLLKCCTRHQLSLGMRVLEVMRPDPAMFSMMAVALASAGKTEQCLSVVNRAYELGVDFPHASLRELFEVLPRDDRSAELLKYLDNRGVCIDQFSNILSNPQRTTKYQHHRRRPKSYQEPDVLVVDPSPAPTAAMDEYTNYNCDTTGITPMPHPSMPQDDVMNTYSYQSQYPMYAHPMPPRQSHDMFMQQQMWPWGMPWAQSGTCADLDYVDGYGGWEM